MAGMLTRPHSACRLIPAAPRSLAQPRFPADLDPHWTTLSQRRSTSNSGRGFCVKAAAAGAGAGDGSSDSEDFHEEMRRLAAPYPGVSWNRRRKKFVASIWVDGTSKYLGLFQKPEAAAAAVRVARQEHPSRYRAQQGPVGTPADWESEEFHKAREKEAAQHRGVHWNRDARKFVAQIGGSQGMQHLGYFQAAAEAGAAYAEARSRDPYVLPPAKFQSEFTGVSWHVPVGKWVARHTWEGKQHSLGYHDDEVDAARAVRDFLDTHCGGWRNPRGVYLEEEGGPAA